MRLSKPQKIFALLSLLLLLTDVGFVAANYWMAHRVFNHAIQERGEQQQHAYQLALNMELTSLQRMATFLAQDKQVQRWLGQAKLAVEYEGGGAGETQAARIRQQLLDALQPTWQHMQIQLGIHQLHFYLAPEALSFLRMHSPETFGDRLDQMRSMVLDTHQDQQARSGFETGHTYSSLRGVAPVFVEVNGQSKHIGALEIGASFTSMLNVLGTQLHGEIAILLHTQYVEKRTHFTPSQTRVWQFSKDHSYVLEATSNVAAFEPLWLAFKTRLQLPDNTSLHTQVLALPQQYLMATHFPLYDYRHQETSPSAHVGHVVLWGDIEQEVADLQTSVRTNIIFAVLAYGAIEILLYLTIRFMTERLNAEIQQRTQALQYSQAALQHSHESLNKAQAIAHLGNWEWNLVTGGLQWSDEVYEIFGLTEPVLTATYATFIEGTHPDDRALVDAAVSQALNHPDREYDIEHRIVRPDGEVRFVRERGAVTYDSQDKPLSMLGTVQDITEKKCTELALERAHTRFTAVLDGIDAVIYVADMQTHELLYVNHKLKTLYQADVGQICWQVLQKNQHGPCDFCTNDKLLDAEGTPTGTYVWEFQNTRNGMWMKCSDSAIVWDEKDRLVRLEIASDITSNKQTEAELLRAKQAAEAANRAKSAFLANMSHELRTPLNVILGFAQILEMDALSENQLSQIHSIRHGGDYLLTLINDILDLAKIEAGRFELFPNTWDTQTFFDTLSKMFRMRAQQKGVQVLYEADPDLPRRLYCDEKRLRQVLMNLLSNAVKFTEQGWVRLSVNFAQGHLHIAVEDSGAGMSTDELSHIFEAFTQVGDAEHKTQGTGLGLSITRRLVQLMNGDIQVHSCKGQGSHFQVRLPAEVVSTLEEAHLSHPLPTRPIVGYQRLKGDIPVRLLVVEDIADNRVVLQQLLKPLKFELHEVGSGEECLAFLEQATCPPDAVLMDLRLPGLNGLETTQRIRTQSAFLSLPIIAISASAFSEVKQRSLQAGCCAHVSKPLCFSELLAELEYCLPIHWKYAEYLESKPSYEPHLPLNPEQLDTALTLTVNGDIYTLDQYLRQQVQEAPAGQRPLLQELLTLSQEFELERLQARLMELKS